MRQLSTYDIECGTELDAAFAIFQGRDPQRMLARVFAALVHRRTRGLPDGTNTPLGLEGAGWIGFVGLVRDRAGAGATDETTVFASIVDGARAAALQLQERGFEEVQAAYRSGDPLRLARAIEECPLRARIDLTFLQSELAGVAHKWWSVTADKVRFRRVRSASSGVRRGSA